ncbi:hypothetical protein ECG_03625 [Echinococcus granulosus]|nr:hypothetical protein ECG_03625 [Echinococcus granulosus]
MKCFYLSCSSGICHTRLNSEDMNLEVSRSYRVIYLFVGVSAINDLPTRGPKRLFSGPRQDAFYNHLRYTVTPPVCEVDAGTEHSQGNSTLQQLPPVAFFSSPLHNCHAVLR